MADAFSIRAFFRQLHPLNLIDSLCCLILSDRTIMVADY